MSPEINRTITDLRARLRLGGEIAAQAVKDVKAAWDQQSADLGKVKRTHATAKALGVGARTLERAVTDFPDLAKALGL